MRQQLIMFMWRVWRVMSEPIRRTNGSLDAFRMFTGLIMLLGVYWSVWFVYEFYFYGNPPLVHNGLATVDAAEYRAGDVLTVSFDYCAMVADPAILRIRWVDGITYNEVERFGVTYLPGCAQTSVRKIIPNIPPGVYTLQWELSFELPLHKRQVFIWSDEFKIVE